MADRPGVRRRIGRGRVAAAPALTLAVAAVAGAVAVQHARSSEPAAWLVLGGFALLAGVALALSGRLGDTLRRLSTSEARAATILGATPEALIGIDESGIVTDWNPAAEALLGWSAREITGRPAGVVLAIPEPARERAAAGLTAGEDDASRSGGTTGRAVRNATPVELDAVHRDGTTVPVEAVLGASRERGGIRTFVFLRDARARPATDDALRRFAAIVDGTDDAILSTGPDGTVTSWNPAAARLYGYTAAEMIGRHVGLLVPHDRMEELASVMADVALGRRVATFETVHRHKDHHDVPVAVTVSPMLDAGGKVAGACASARDITRSLQQAAALRSTEQLFRLAFDAVPSAMALTSAGPEDTGRIIRVNAGFCWTMGYTSEELADLTLTDLTHPDDRAQDAERLAPFLAGERTSVRFEKRYVRGDGSTVWAVVSTALVEGPDARSRYAITQIEDITARRAEQERLTALALADPLTGLANRLRFDDHLQQAIYRAERHNGYIAVIYCDLDGFKPINDEFGHAVGDELLQQVGHRLIVAVRAADTVARLGGDEFAVVCEDLADAESAGLLAERIRDTVRGTYIVSAGPVDIGCSLGLAVASGAGIDGTELVSAADLAMFVDKRKRRSAAPPGGPALGFGTGTVGTATEAGGLEVRATAEEASESAGTRA
jgi:diguanylate cyclase (GGDEF)-like protein/PAS domain S-box-containing protein